MKVIRNLFFTLLITLLLLAGLEAALSLAERIHPIPQPARVEYQASACISAPGDSDETILKNVHNEIRKQPLLPCRTKEINFDRLEEQRLPDTDWRIFVIGGSNAAGRPHPYFDSYGALLEKKLQKTHPATVVMAGRSGEGSCFVLKNTIRIVDHFHPDLIILFLGNNELFSWSYAPGGDLTADPARTRKLLGKFRIYKYSIQSMRWIFGKAYGKRENELIRRTDTGRCFTDRGILENGIGYEQWIQLQTGYMDKLRTNVRLAIQYAKDHDVPVLLANMPIRHRLPPCYHLPQPMHFLTETEKAEAFNQTLQEAWKQYNDRKDSEALALADKALMMDKRSALAHHLRGRCLERLGKPLESESAYELAREQTLGWLGSMLSVNRTIGELSREFGVPLVDTFSLFNKESREKGRHPGYYITDYCHPSKEGSVLIADAFSKKVLETLQSRQR